MARVTCAPARRRKTKKILNEAKGFYGDRKNHPALAYSVLMKAWAYAYEGRKQKKRDFKSLWIQRINVASRCNGLSYSKLIDGLSKAKIEINRKMLAHLAIEDQKAFSAIAEQAKKALAL